MPLECPVNAVEALQISWYSRGKDSVNAGGTMASFDSEKTLEQIFEGYAVRFEKATTRAEFDQAMRYFLSTIHMISLREHWKNGGSGEAGDAVRRIIQVFRRFREPAPDLPEPNNA